MEIDKSHPNEIKGYENGKKGIHIKTSLKNVGNKLIKNLNNLYVCV